MPTISAKYPISIQAEVIISRDFQLNREKQLAQAFWESLQDMSDDDVIDFLAERITVLSEGEPHLASANGRS